MSIRILAPSRSWTATLRSMCKPFSQHEAYSCGGIAFPTTWDGPTTPMTRPHARVLVPPLISSRVDFDNSRGRDPLFHFVARNVALTDGFSDAGLPRYARGTPAWSLACDR